MRARMIVADGLEKRYGRLREVVALDRVTFRVDRGDVLGLVGGDGAGKSTLIRIFASVLRPTAGRATVAGFDIINDANRLKELIGYLPQSPALSDKMSVAAYLNFWATADGMDRAKRGRRIQELLEFLDLSGQSGEAQLVSTT